MEYQAAKLKELVSKRKRNSKFLTVASGKGGVGKTNFSLNFAYTLGKYLKKKVLLLDADIGMANIHILLNSQNKKSLKDLFNGEKIENIIVKGEEFDAILGFSGIDSFFDMEEISISSLILELEKISANYEYIIIDTGAGIDEKVSSFLRASSNSILVTTPEPTALVDAYSLIKSLYNLYNYRDFKVVVNMVKNKEEAFNVFSKLNSSVKKFLQIEIEMLGFLPNSNNLKKCVKRKEIISKVLPNDSFSIEMKKICAVETQELLKKVSANFWEKVFDFLGQKRKR
jgi:flagellar biosynthesis protein FlhG